MLERVWRKGNPLTYSFGGNVNWCSHYGKQYEVSFKKKKKSHHTIQQSHYWTYIQKR